MKRKNRLLIGIGILALVVATTIFVVRSSTRVRVVDQSVPEYTRSILASGVVISDTREASGQVLLLQTDKTLFFRFENFSMEGEDKNIRLVAAQDLSLNDTIDLGAFGRERGTFNIEVKNESYNPETYPYLLLWSEGLNVSYSFVEMAK